MLPTGWQLIQVQGIDSYVGEVTGEGVRLMFDYGNYSRPLNPEDEHEHEYIVAYEKIGGRDAELKVPAGAPSGSEASYTAATGVTLRKL